jgi:phenylacetate-coenzyme A ligase PaaK-like adenylate-forming protein
VDWLRVSKLSPKEIRRLQEEKLRTFVAEQLPLSPYYRALFEREGIDPRRVRTIADFRRLPFTTKADLLPTGDSPERSLDFVLRPEPKLLRKHWPRMRLLMLLARGRGGAIEHLEREYRPMFATFTTGRSAGPVPFLYSRHDVDLLREGAGRLLTVHGLTREDRIVNLFPYAPHLAFWATTFGGLETGAFVLGTGGGKVLGSAGTVRAIERLKASALVGVPGFVHHCLRRAKELGSVFPQVRTVVLGAEKLPDALRDRIREAVGEMGAKEVAVLGTYGFTEARMAWGECREGEGEGYHLYPDLAFLEIVDPETGEPRGPGEDGEIVFTPLEGRASTVLRYRTGDLSQGGIVEEPCPHCGRSVPRLSSSITRKTNVADLRLVKMKGTLVSLDEIAGVLGSFREVEEWQIELRRENDDPFGLDELVVYAALGNGTSAEDFTARLREAMRNACEVTPNRVEILPLSALLERLGMETEMKEKRFVDRRPKG